MGTPITSVDKQLDVLGRTKSQKKTYQTNFQTGDQTRQIKASH